MSRKGQTPQDEDQLHSSAAAFEVRHQTGASSERGRAARRVDEATGFTRRCGRRAPADKSPCMHTFGHDGPHTWEPEAGTPQADG
jgi:hypothetical protein